jgi:dipeptide transport system permease protein
MERKLGLDRPLVVQYALFVKGIFQGDLGKSVVTRRNVSEEFFERFPATMELGLLALLWASLLGVPLGILAAFYRNKAVDYFIMTGSLIGYSMPIFWWGLILILVFSVQLGLTPVSGRISVFYDVESVTGFLLIDTLLMEDESWEAFVSAFRHLILPSLALGTIPLAIIARMTRSSMIDVLDQPYMRTARAKGLRPLRIIIFHGLRNALIQVVTVIGLMFSTIVTGAILTETIFSWPGIGKWMVASVMARDYPVIQSGIVVIAMMVVCINLCIDMIYKVLDPRMRGQ